MAYYMPPTAFSVSPSKGKRRPRQRNDGHLDWLRTLGSVISGGYPVEAAHIRMADVRFHKRETGKSEKPDDKWCLPLTAEEHRLQHTMSEKDFWNRHAIDPCEVALALYLSTGDDVAAEHILRRSREAAATMRQKS